MALVAWYPLNGNISNNGDSNFDLISNGTLTYTSGKIGKAVKFEKNYLKANISPFKNTTAYSICGWIYLDNIPSITHTIICSRTNIGYGLSLFVTTEKKMRFDASIDSTSLQWTVNYTFETEKWTHFAVINDNGNLSCFINGTLQQTKVVTSTTQHIGDYITIGASSESNTIIGNNNYFKGRINDLRIYDNALSEFEIQEIYRSVILKYSFDTPIYNPTISTVATTNIANLLNGKTNQCAIIGEIAYNKDYFVDNNYFTISFDLTIKDVVGKSGEINSGISLQGYTSIEGADKWNTMVNPDYELNNKTNKIGDFSGNKDIDLSKNGVYHILRTYKLENTSQYSSVFNIQTRCDYLESGTITVSNFEVVLGKKTIISDGTDGILYDESGFRHNAKVSGSTNFLPALYYSTDSKIGEGCYQSRTKTDNGENTYGLIKTSEIFYEIPEISIAFWLYVPESDNNTGDNTIIGCSANAENYGIWIRRKDVSLTVNLYHISLSSQIKLKRNAWQYIVVTAQKQGDLKIYIDGELSAEKHNISGIDWEDAYFTIGDLRNGRGLSFDGKIDDLKTYATILNEDYIKDEYRERAKVDNIGNFYCKQISENIPWCLPKEYQELDYLKNIDNQYIDTGIIPTNNIVINVALEFEQINTVNTFFFGTKNSTMGYYFGYGWGGNNFAFRCGESPVQQSTKPIINKIYDVFFGYNFLEIDGIRYYNSTNSNSIDNKINTSIFLFGVNNSGSVYDEFQGKIYQCKIYDNNRIVKHFIPCYRKSDEKIGMYDLIERAFYPSLGTSSLIKGNEVSKNNGKIQLLNNGEMNVHSINEEIENTKVDIYGNKNSLQAKQIYEY